MIRFVVPYQLNKIYTLHWCALKPINLNQYYKQKWHLTVTKIEYNKNEKLWRRKKKSEVENRWWREREKEKKRKCKIMKYVYRVKVTIFIEIMAVSRQPIYSHIQFDRHLLFWKHIVYEPASSDDSIRFSLADCEFSSCLSSVCPSLSPLPPPTPPPHHHHHHHHRKHRRYCCVVVMNSIESFVKLLVSFVRLGPSFDFPAGYTTLILL